MIKIDVKKRLRKLIKDPNYEFRFQMAGCFSDKEVFKCDICEKMVNSLVQTAYGKTDDRGSVHLCFDCNQQLINLK